LCNQLPCRVQEKPDSLISGITGILVAGFSP
jgi:hypothetical protein